jgi:tellurite resistance protein
MRRTLYFALIAALALSACGDGQQSATNRTSIKVRSNEQEQLHMLDALNL